MAHTKATAPRKPATAETAQWTTERDTFLVNQLLERAATGGRIDATFTREAWALTVKEFNAKFKTNYDLQQLKNRIIAVSRYYYCMIIIMPQELIIWFNCSCVTSGEPWITWLATTVPAAGDTTRAPTWWRQKMRFGTYT